MLSSRTQIYRLPQFLNKIIIKPYSWIQVRLQTNNLSAIYNLIIKIVWEMNNKRSNRGLRTGWMTIFKSCKLIVNRWLESNNRCTYVSSTRIEAVHRQQWDRKHDESKLLPRCRLYNTSGLLSIQHEATWHQNYPQLSKLAIQAKCSSHESVGLTRKPLSMLHR